MQSIKVWSTLHFLGKDTPYCCMEPGCHLGLFCGAPTIRDVMCRKLKINPSVELEFVDMAAYVHASAKFEDVF